jgi:hypothetical protein
MNDKEKIEKLRGALSLCFTLLSGLQNYLDIRKELKVADEALRLTEDKPHANDWSKGDHY